MTPDLKSSFSPTDERYQDYIPAERKRYEGRQHSSLPAPRGDGGELRFSFPFKCLNLLLFVCFFIRGDAS
jgi:hypothetical protein